MTFTDTHCHIHEESYADSEGAYERALKAGVRRMICVGTDIVTSLEAAQFASGHANAWAIIGIHPHEAARESDKIKTLRRMLSAPQVTKIVGIGEIGLDYYYNHSPRDTQIAVLEAQLQIAVDHDLPVSFHVREAFDDFWPVFDSFPGLRGVLHSYTDNLSNMEKGLSRGLWIGVNGIATFAKDKTELYQAVPAEKMLLETDAPYLTPHPHRGKVNEPALVKAVAQYMANLQSINLQELSLATESSATRLFKLK